MERQEHIEANGHDPWEEEQEQAEADEHDPWEEEQYFGSYGSFALQRSMLADSRRNAAFRIALEAVCADKVVLDVGCGTGLLSLMAHRAGARRVYAVEASSMAWHAHKVVEANGASEKVFVTQQKAEQLELGEKVDVLVSEWLGSFAFFESMVESVIMARERLLAEGGIMIPSHVSLFCAPVLWMDPDVVFWSSQLEGFDFSHIGNAAHQQKILRPVHNLAVDAEALQADEQRVGVWDMRLLKVEDLELIESSEMVFVPRGRKINGVVVWFAAAFEPSSVVLSTAPTEPPTHWNQELLLFDREIEVPAASSVHLWLTIERNSYWRRHYVLRLRGHVRDGEETLVDSFEKVFPHHRFPTQTKAK